MSVYAAFIFSCGLTHVTSALMFHYPVYRLDTLARILCAGISVVAAGWTWYAAIAAISKQRQCYMCAHGSSGFVPLESSIDKLDKLYEFLTGKDTPL